MNRQRLVNEESYIYIDTLYIIVEWELYLNSVCMMASSKFMIMSFVLTTFQNESVIYKVGCRAALFSLSQNQIRPSG